MGLFDDIRCEMPLPETAEPPPGEWFQTKDTPEQYLAKYTITRDGRLSWRPDWRQTTEEFLDDYHGDIEFGNISIHCGRFSGGKWQYRARFTSGKCDKIELLKFTPTDPALIAEIDAEVAA